MRTVTLKSTNLITLTHDDQLFVTGFHAQRGVFIEVGQPGHGVFGHGEFSKGGLWNGSTPIYPNGLRRADDWSAVQGTR